MERNGSLEMNIDVYKNRITRKGIEESVRVLQKKHPSRKIVILIDLPHHRYDFHFIEVPETIESPNPLLLRTDGSDPQESEDPHTIRQNPDSGELQLSYNIGDKFYSSKMGQQPQTKGYADIVRISGDPHEDLAKYDMSETGFICAFNSDQQGSKYTSYIIKNQGLFLGSHDLDTWAWYWHLNDKARKIVEWSLSNCPSHKSPEQWINIIQAIEITKKIPGEYVEIGVFRGTSAKIAYDYHNAIGLQRTLSLMDTFKGFFYETATESPDIAWNGTHLVNRNQKLMLTRMKVYLNKNTSQPPPANYELVAHNICDDSDEKSPLHGKLIAVCNIDVDMYEAVLASLRKTAPLMAPGGIMIIQDPGKTPYLIGARAALDEFLDEDSNKTKFTSIYFSSSGQTYLIKK